MSDQIRIKINSLKISFSISDGFFYKDEKDVWYVLFYLLVDEFPDESLESLFPDELLVRNSSKGLAALIVDDERVFFWFNGRIWIDVDGLTAVAWLIWRIRSTKMCLSSMAENDFIDGFLIYVVAHLADYQSIHARSTNKQKKNIELFYSSSFTINCSWFVPANRASKIRHVFIQRTRRPFSFVLFSLVNWTSP